jgi:hypothetical protein
MNSQSASQLLSTIDQTKIDIAKVSGADATVDAYLAKFLVVYICGIYEEAIEQIIIDFSKKNSTRQEIIEFMAGSLDRYFRNPDFAKVCDLIGLFGNKSWKENLKLLVSEGRALDSIVSNKNALAHGQTVTITLTQVLDYYDESRKVVERIDSLMT